MIVHKRSLTKFWNSFDILITFTFLLNFNICKPNFITSVNLVKAVFIWINARPRVAIHRRNYVNNKNVNHLKSPAKSLDLNPIKICMVMNVNERSWT